MPAISVEKREEGFIPTKRRNSKHEIPACGRQANFETNLNDRNRKFKTENKVSF
jgi:hypothetical protein